MTLEGKKVRLRPVSTDDVDHIMEWVNDHEVTRTILSGRYPQTREAEEQWIEEHLKPKPTEVVFVIESLAGDYLGGISLFHIHPVEHHAELGIVIGKKNQWGKGFATEAMQLLVAYGFDQLNLHMIYLTVMDTNERAAGIYERVGFRHEGRLRHRVYRDGTYRDLVSMSVLRSEWEEGSGS